MENKKDLKGRTINRFTYHVDLVHELKEMTAVFVAGIKKLRTVRISDNFIFLIALSSHSAYSASRRNYTDPKPGKIP